jgi:hypothetical protein
MTTIAKEIRWGIWSFINEPSEQKKIFSREVLGEFKQFFLKKELIIKLTPGTRKVVYDEDLEQLCLNCYHYGPYERDGMCTMHGWGGLPTGWMTFKDFQRLSHFEVPDTWDEYKQLADDEEVVRREEEHNYFQSIEGVYQLDWEDFS